MIVCRVCSGGSSIIWIGLVKDPLVVGCFVIALGYFLLMNCGDVLVRLWGVLCCLLRL